jgi:hypothetical protein
VAASRLEADELRCRLNDLEDYHEALPRAALDAVRVVRPEGICCLTVSGPYSARSGTRWR